jgi:hypothetical protein
MSGSQLPALILLSYWIMEPLALEQIEPPAGYIVSIFMDIIIS